MDQKPVDSLEKMTHIALAYFDPKPGLLEEEPIS